jgi:integrase
VCEYPVGQYGPNYRSAALTAILVILKLEMGFKLAPKVIYVIAVTMGLRKSEILGLRWQDVDFEQGTVNISHIVTEIQGKIVTGTPKTASSRRTVPMPTMVTDTLKEHQQVKGKSEGLIFTTSTGRPVSQRNVSRHFHKALEYAGLPKIRFHDLRHTAATLLLKENVHPKVVQEMLGHSSIALTLDTYSHVLPGVGKKAADKMDELFHQ